MKVEVMTILLFYEIKVTRSFDKLHIALCVLILYTVLLYTVTNTEPVSDGVDLTVHVMHTKNRHLLFTPVSASTRKCSVYCRKSY